MYQFFSRPDLYVARCGDLRCRVVERQMEGAPSFLRGVRALFITDVHVTARTTDADLEAFAGRIASLHPDILLYGGDFADRAKCARALFERLSGLKPPLGSYGVVGNNDCEAWPDLEELRSVMAKAGIELLLNQSRTIALNGGRLVVAGIDEYYRGHPDTTGLYPDAASPDCWRVLLSHFPIIPRRLPDLMLSGHTHGGQFNLLGITPYTIWFERTPLSNRPSRFIEGLHEHHGLRILVSKGIGASRIPLRLFVRPEIELIEFS